MSYDLSRQKIILVETFNLSSANAFEFDPVQNAVIWQS